MTVPRKFRTISATSLQTSACAAALIFAAYSSAALAQATGAPSSPADCTDKDANGNCAGDDAAQIVVTGSRISRREIEAASPLQVIDDKQLDARGFQTVAQALNELPTFGVPGASPVGFNQSTFGAGQSFVNFLGLGSQRTLTLVNGRRFVSSNTGSIFGPTGNGGTQVDLNIIPTKLIQRVETVAAIGAPIYGSDAVAGTINILLKKDYQGIDIDVQNGISSRGDASDQRIRVLAGKNFAGGRGNFTIAGEYNKSKGLFYTDRAQTAFDDRFDSAASGSGPQVIYRDLRVPSVDPSGIPMVTDFLILTPQQSGGLFDGYTGVNVGIMNAAGDTLRFAPDGSLIPVNFGSTVGDATGFSVFTSGGNGYSLSSVSNLLTDLERYSVNGNLSYDLSDDVHFFSEAWYSVSKGRNLAGQPVYNSALFGPAGSKDGNLIISLNNPFLSPAARATIQNSIATSPFSDSPDQDYFYLARASTDLSSGVSTGKSEVMRFVAGFDGTLRVLPGREWKFEAYFNYGRANVTSKNPELNQQNFLNALNSTTSGGQIICAPGSTNSPVATISSVCAPINPFGQQISQAARDYVTTIATPRTLNHQYDAVASVAGPLFKLPGGDFSFSLGYEHRKEDSAFDPGVFYFGSGTGGSDVRGSYGRSVPIDPVSGSYYTNEVFGELSADLISAENGVPLIHELSIQAAGRYIWNSKFGNDPTYTVQGRWSPVKDLAFRAAYTRAVRAPSITEAFNPSSSAFGFATDVCDRALVSQGPDPTRRAANCTAAGVPITTYTSLSSGRSFPTFTFGNPALQNEKADSYSAGVVLTPRFIPGFNATIDYVDITIKEAITAFSNSEVVAACYDSTSYPANPFCALVTRDPTTHQLSNVGTTYFNSAKVKYKGIIAQLNYVVQRPFLAMTARWA